jgi:acyl carrier protein
MNPNDLRAQLCTFIDDAVSLDPDTPVAPDTDLLMTGLVDSLGVVQIVSWMEQELGIVVEPTDVVLEHFQTVDAMAGFVERRRALTDAAPAADPVGHDA